MTGPKIETLASSGDHAASGKEPWADPWYDALPHLVAKLFFGRVRLHGADRIPRSSPTLFLGLHRNGAADGWIYASVLPRPVDFMISVQLRRHLIGRLMARGIEVVRDKDDGDRAQNARALTEAADRLAGGGAVFVFPEGTSTLGPSHLPFRTGAARVARELLGRGSALTVVPLAIHYEAPVHLGSDVHIVVGEPIKLRSVEGVADLQERFGRALEQTGIHFADAATQSDAEQLARIAGDAGEPYPTALGRPITAEDRVRLARWRAAAAADRPLTWLGLPIAARRFALTSLLMGSAGCLISGLGLLLNLVPAALGFWAGRRLADDRNTITFWRIMVGFPALAAWSLIAVVAAQAMGAPLLTVAYLAVTGFAARFHAASRRRFVAGWNALFHRRFATLYREIQDHAVTRPSA